MKYVLSSSSLSPPPSFFLFLLCFLFAFLLFVLFSITIRDRVVLSVAYACGGGVGFFPHRRAERECCRDTKALTAVPESQLSGQLVLYHTRSASFCSGSFSSSLLYLTIYWKSHDFIHLSKLLTALHCSKSVQGC